MPVCLSACTSKKNHAAKLHEIFCTCQLGPWLGSLLTTMEYVIYSGFVDDVICFPILDPITRGVCNIDVGEESSQNVSTYSPERATLFDFVVVSELIVRVTFYDP